MKTGIVLQGHIQIQFQQRGYLISAVFQKKGTGQMTYEDP